MDDLTKKKIWTLIQLKGDELKGKLSNHPRHPDGRNPYAHISSLINEKFGCSYKDVNDEIIPDLINFITNIKS